MADISISIKNESGLLKAFKKAPQAMGKGLQDSLLKLGVFTTGEVKKVITSGENMWKSPIDTGTMRRGIQMRQLGKLQVVIAPSEITPYALFVHEGTRFMKARPFFQITADSRKRTLEKFFSGEISAIVKTLLK